MKTSTKFLSVFLLLALLFVPMQSVSAKGLGEGPVIFGGSYTVSEGETLNSDLVVFGGFVMVEEGGLVNGSVVLIGGNLTVDGEVNGDVVIVGGMASLGEEAIVRGDLAVVGATLQRAEGALIEGDLVYNVSEFRIGGETTVIEHPAATTGTPSVIEPSVATTGTPSVIEPPSVPIVPFTPITPNSPNGWSNPLWLIFGVFGRAIAMSLLAMLVVMFLPEPTRRVGQAAVDQPGIAGGIGFLTILVSPLALLALTITIILIPVAFLAGLLILVAILYGWIALGLEVGERFTKMLNWNFPLPLSAGFGTLLLTLVSASVGLIPCIGWMMPFLIAMLALGGVIISRFGSQTVLKPAPVMRAEVVETSSIPPVDGEPEPEE